MPEIWLYMYILYFTKRFTAKNVLKHLVIEKFCHKKTIYNTPVDGVLAADPL